MESDAPHEMEDFECHRQPDRRDSEYGRHEMEFKNSECNEQSDIKCSKEKIAKGNNDKSHEKVNSADVPVAMCSFLDDSISFDGPIVDESTDVSIGDIEQSDMFTTRNL